MKPDGSLAWTVPEVEPAFAGLLLHNPDRVGDARMLVHPSQIENIHVRSVVSMLYAEDDANRRPTEASLADALDKSSLNVPDAGWAGYLDFLAYEHFNAAHLGHFARTITEGHRAREAAKLMHEARVELDENRPGTGACDDVLDRLQSSLEALDGAADDVQESIDAPDAGDELIDAIARGETYSGVATELADLDELLMGMRPGEMYVIGARPGCGKTTLALQIALNAATSGVRTVFFSLEVQTQELTERLLANISGLDGRVIRKRDMDKGQVAQLREANKQLPKGLRLKSDSGTSVHKLRAILRRYKRKGGLGLVVVDYLQLLRAPGEENRVREVSVISATLKDLSKELACPILVCCQLNRSADGEVARLSHLRESGSIENDSDVVLLLSADDGARTLDCTIAKNRHGPGGTVKFYWDKELFRVRNYGIIQAERIA